MTALPLALSAALAAQDTSQTAASDATRTSFRLLEMPAPWIVVLILVPGIFAIAYFGYRRESLARGARLTMAGLRAASLFFLLLVLFRPVRVKHQENVAPPEVVVLLDDSASMSRQDVYGGADSALGDLRSASGGLDPRDTSRQELARAIVQREVLPALERNGYETRLYRFSESLAPLATLETDSGARGRATHLGDAIVAAVRAQRGRHVTDLVVVSDGRSNGGTGALDAAELAKSSGIPVHTLVVGDVRRERNWVVELVEAPEAVLEGDEIAIIARVHATGFDASDASTLLLEEFEEDVGEPRLVSEELVDMSSSGDRIVLVAPPASAGLDAAERRFRLTVPPGEGETLVDDNTIEFSVRVTPEKIRVLYVDGYPRWEYRFLNRLLKRADDRISVQCYLLSASANFLHEASRDLDNLTFLPTDRKQLLDNYDVIILGDVNPYAVSADPRIGEEFAASIREFVERGGGLCLIAGEYDNPKAIAGTDFAKLLPVHLDATGSLAFEGDPTQEFRPVLEDPLAPHEIVRLHKDLDTNRRLWEDAGGLSGFFWYAPVVDAKPGAQVLLRHPYDSTRSGERNPLLVVGYHPQGRTMYLGVDSTWRWRKRYVDRYHERFWRNAVRWLALGRLKGSDRRYQLEPLRASYALDERVVLEARILDEDYRPSTEERRQATVQGPEGGPSELELIAVEGRPGLYRGGFDAARPGLHRGWIEIDGRKVATTEVEVQLPSREKADPSPDPETMAAVARICAGVSLPLGRASELSAQFPSGQERREPISSQLEDAWDNWGTLLVALFLLSIEWVLRKRHELI